MNFETQQNNKIYKSNNANSTSKSLNKTKIFNTNIPYNKYLLK